MLLLSMTNVSYAYPLPDGEATELLAPVLQDVCLSVNEGEFVAVLGANGSGKSTLVRLANGITLPTSGRVEVCGLCTANEESSLQIRSAMGTVFQNPDNQLVASIVEEDVAFALENLAVPSAEIRVRVDEALKTVDMYEYRLHAPHKLSGGQKQRVAIAGVLAMNPKCIMLDEPTAMLDPSGRAEVMHTLLKLNKRGVTVILITHHMDEAAQAKRVVVLDSGRIAIDAPPREVFAQTNKLRELRLNIPPALEVCRELGIETAVLNEEEAAAAIYGRCFGSL